MRNLKKKENKEKKRKKKEAKKKEKKKGRFHWFTPEDFAFPEGRRLHPRFSSVEPRKKPALVYIILTLPLIKLYIIKKKFVKFCHFN